MAIPHASPGMAADLKIQGEELSQAKTFALMKNEAFQAIRMAVPRDFEACHNHQLSGPITLQCIEGEIALTADGDTRLLRAGQWTFLNGGVPHTIKGIEDSLLLLTVIFA